MSKSRRAEKNRRERTGSAATQAGGKIAEMLRQALAAHRQGRHAQAEKGYREILALEPAHVDTLCFLAALYLERGDAPHCNDLLQRAIRIDPRYPTAYLLLGNCMRQLGRPHDALASYDQALALRPEYTEAWSNRGSALRALERLDEAVASYDRALALKPDFADAWNNRGNALRELDRLPDALASFDRAVELRPDYADAWNNRGRTLLDLGRADAALASHDRAIALKPDLADAFNNRGSALRTLKRLDEALASYERAIALNPDHATPRANRGNVLLDLNRAAAALESYERAIALKPDYTEACVGRGNALRALNRPADALASYDRAIALAPRHADAWNNRGAALQMLKRLDEALASYARSLEFAPGNAHAHWNESLCRLLMGEYERGWRQYEWRWKVESLDLRPAFSHPLWLGAEALAGRTVLLHAEQGLGDTIQFCRYASLAAARGARVVMAVQPALKSLLASLKEVSQVYTEGERLPACDCRCPLMSLPLAFGTRLETVPAPVPYLSADPRQVLRWRALLGERTAPRIALAWAGNPKNPHDLDRSLPLRLLLQALPAEVQTEVSCYSLQKDLREGDRELLAERPDITHIGNALADFQDTAAVIAQMDVIVTVDTAVAHLAGALGKPVWLLLPFVPDFRWLLEREDSPWYPTARLFRQRVPGDWTEVTVRVRDALRRHIQEGR